MKKLLIGIATAVLMSGAAGADDGTDLRALDLLGEPPGRRRHGAEPGRRGVPRRSHQHARHPARQLRPARLLWLLPGHAHRGVLGVPARPWRLRQPDGALRAAGEPLAPPPRPSSRDSARSRTPAGGRGPPLPAPSGQRPADKSPSEPLASARSCPDHEPMIGQIPAPPAFPRGLGHFWDSPSSGMSRNLSRDFWRRGRTAAGAVLVARPRQVRPLNFERNFQ